MQQIYIDISTFVHCEFVTGIQRVVQKVVLEMLQKIPNRIVLIEDCGIDKGFRVINSEAFAAYYQGHGTNRNKRRLFTKHYFGENEIPAGSIFFDIDSVWESVYSRSALLPILKARGVKLAVYLHDIIPITDPEYCFKDTVLHFMYYIGAYLQYADCLISSTQSTLDAVYQLSEQLNLPHVPGFVSWLGSDFVKQEVSPEKIAPEVIRALEGKRYLLTVGTIEPRKNHALLLDALENGLQQEDMCLVFAGRIGWDVNALIKRIESSPCYGKQLFLFSGMNDATINYLYQHAFLVVFPTFNEGFGLPIIEAFQKNTLVLASDIPVLREVGGDFCDYFSPNDPAEFVELVRKYKNEPTYCERKKEQLKNYIPFTWEQTAQKIIQALDSLRPQAYLAKDNVKQIVLITARTADLQRTLPYIEKYLPFIEQAVVCCADSIQKEVQECKVGRLSMKIVTDSQLLRDLPLPEDHAT